VIDHGSDPSPEAAAAPIEFEQHAPLDPSQQVFEVLVELGTEVFVGLCGADVGASLVEDVASDDVGLALDIRWAVGR
jgi:hypothetical protein